MMAVADYDPWRLDDSPQLEEHNKLVSLEHLTRRKDWYKNFFLRVTTLLCLKRIWVASNICSGLPYAGYASEVSCLKSEFKLIIFDWNLSHRSEYNGKTQKVLQSAECFVLFLQVIYLTAATNLYIFFLSFFLRRHFGSHCFEHIFYLEKKKEHR